MSKSWERGSDTRWRRFRLTILDRDSWRCTLGVSADCEHRANQVHHITPLARGGPKYDPANCTSACAPCNQEIGDRAPAPQPAPRPVTRWEN